MSDSESSPLSGAPETPASVLFTGPSWQEQDEVLRDLWMKNKTPQEIASILSRSVAAIMTRAARLGLPRRSAPGRKPGSRRPISEDQHIQIPVTGTSTGGSTSNVRHNARTTTGDGAVQTSPRVCLMCLRSFQSLGRHNRICPSCKSSGEYASATSMADIHFPT